MKGEPIGQKSGDGVVRKGNKGERQSSNFTLRAMLR
jgi:hypothetical protein